jgi:hypothetical protein
MAARRAKSPPEEETAEDEDTPRRYRKPRVEDADPGSDTEEEREEHEEDAKPHYRFRMLEEGDGRLDFQWRMFFFMAVVAIVLSPVVIGLSFATEQAPLGWAYVAVFFLTGFGLIVLGFMKFYTLVFFYLAYQLAALVYTLIWLVQDIGDVYICRSPRCSHGKKWLFTWDFVMLGIFVGFFIVVCRACLICLTTYRQF